MESPQWCFLIQSFWPKFPLNPVVPMIVLATLIPCILSIPSPASSLLLNPESRRSNKENPETYSGASSWVGEISIYLISANIRLLIWVLLRVKTLSMLDRSCVHKEMSNWLSSRTEYSCLDVRSLWVVSIFPLSNAPYSSKFQEEQWVLV